MRPRELSNQRDSNGYSWGSGVKSIFIALLRWRSRWYARRPTSPDHRQVDAGGVQRAAVEAHGRWSAGQDREVTRAGAGDREADAVARREQVRRRQQVEAQLGDLARDQRLGVAALERSVTDGLAIRRRRTADPAMD